MSSTFGKNFKISTFGESHGTALGVVIDGCPANLTISTELIQADLDRRRPGQSSISTPRAESDQVECLSGLQDNITLGSPLTFIVYNHDIKKNDYNDLKNVFRPSHADFTYFKKYGVLADSGGGRASARETLARVIAGSVAKQVLLHKITAYKSIAYVESVKDIKLDFDESKAINYTQKKIDSFITRCPDEHTNTKMLELITKTQANSDSVGGVVRGILSGLPIGLGEPVFDRFEANLAKAILSLPACKGFDIGLGFDSTQLFGSENNDQMSSQNNKIIFHSNNAGGVQAGITNGNNVVFRAAFKPVSTIFKQQHTIDSDNNNLNFKPKSGRHDPCVLARATPIVEAMANIVVLDMLFSSTQ